MAFLDLDPSHDVRLEEARQHGQQRTRRFPWIVLVQSHLAMDLEPLDSGHFHCCA